MFLTILITGLAVGSMYAAAAIVYNIMYSTSKVLSFTAGYYFMIGTVVAAYCAGPLMWPLPISILAALLVGAVFGFITELVAVRRILAKTDQHLWLLSTLALAIMVQQIVALTWGTEPRPFPRLFDQSYTSGLLDQKYWLPIITVPLVDFGLIVFLKKTFYGKLFTAVAEDAFAARAMGVSTDLVRFMSYGLAGGVGGLLGVVGGQLLFADFTVGLTLALYGFVALAVGGMGSHIGAIVGGLLLGIVATSAIAFIGAEYKNTVAIGLLMLFLIVRPKGLFGRGGSRTV